MGGKEKSAVWSESSPQQLHSLSNDQRRNERLQELTLPSSEHASTSYTKSTAFISPALAPLVTPAEFSSILRPLSPRLASFNLSSIPNPFPLPPISSGLPPLSHELDPTSSLAVSTDDANPNLPLSFSLLRHRLVPPAFHLHLEFLGCCRTFRRRSVEQRSGGGRMEERSEEGRLVGALGRGLWELDGLGWWWRW